MLPRAPRIFQAVVPGRLFSSMTHDASRPYGPALVTVPARLARAADIETEADGADSCALRRAAPTPTTTEPATRARPASTSTAALVGRRREPLPSRRPNQ